MQKQEIVELELPSEPFCLIEASNRYENGFLKDHLDCKQYIAQYFYPLKNGDNAFYEADQGGITIMTKERLKSVYLDRLPKEISKCYLKSAIKLCDYAFNVKAGLIFESNGRRYINMFPGFKFKTKRLPTDNEKEGIKLLWDHVKNVLCSGNEQVYEFVRKWFSHVATGRKMQVALFMKSQQGSGKGTFTEFFFKQVMGLQNVFMASDPNCLIGRFNGQLKGKLLLVLEEMRALSVAEWTAVNDKLKNLISDSTTNYEDKYATAFVGENNLSVIILSNNECIKLPHDDRRYLVMDVSSEKIGDIEYFDKLNKFTKHTPEFAEAFYWDCISYAENSSEWKEYQDILTISTCTKTDIVIKHMDQVYKFIKNKFILKQKGMDIFLKNLTEMYNQSKERNKREGREIAKLLREIGIIGKTSTGNWTRYRISYEDLLDIYTKKGFIDDNDEYDCDVYVPDKKSKAVIYEKERNVNVIMVHQVKKLEARVKELEAENKQLMSMGLQTKVITTKENLAQDLDQLKLMFKKAKLCEELTKLFIESKKRRQKYLKKRDEDKHQMLKLCKNIEKLLSVQNKPAKKTKCEKKLEHIHPCNEFVIILG